MHKNEIKEKTMHLFVNSMGSKSKADAINAIFFCDIEINNIEDNKNTFKTAVGENCVFRLK